MRRNIKTATLIFSTAISSVLFTSCATKVEQPTALAAAKPTQSSPEVAAAQKVIEAMPASAIGHTQLAAAYIRLARVTGDFAVNAKAVEAVERALEIAPKDPNARRLKASLMLTYHEFGDALALGQTLNDEFPNDFFVHGIMTDANTELGNFPEGVAWAQKMVDLKPNSSSYARVAHLRSFHGDHPGAVEMYKLSARTADPADKEAQAWAITQLGDEYWRRGNYPQAVSSYDEALGLLPAYPLALVGKGRAQASLGNFSEARSNVEKAANVSAHTEWVLLLGDINARMGDVGSAQRWYAQALTGEEALGELHDAHRLARFWADHNINLDNALMIAREDHAAQKDLYASDTLAWILYRKGEFIEARKFSREALRLGENDALIVYHAGMIEKALGNQREAERLLRLSLRLNPEFDLIAKSELVRNLTSGS